MLYSTRVKVREQLMGTGFLSVMWNLLTEFRGLALIASACP